MLKNREQYHNEQAKKAVLHISRTITLYRRTRYWQITSTPREN